MTHEYTFKSNTSTCRHDIKTVRKWKEIW